MNIVLEGPDGSGKSSLAVLLYNATGMAVQQGSGPPKSPEEIEARLARYLTIDGVIFDRHPAVSQPIYAGIRDEALTPVFQALVCAFYETQPLLVYCRATDLRRHVVKPGEDPAHIDALTRRYAQLLDAYDRWASAHAHLIFRIGDDPLDVVKLLTRVARGS